MAEKDTRKAEEIVKQDQAEEQADSDSLPDKSYVKANRSKHRKNRAPREFEDDARVRATVSDGRRSYVKTFLVAYWRDTGSTYQYQLKDELTGTLAAGGKWFWEDDLTYAGEYY